MLSFIADPWFYIVAAPCIALIGMGKGGFGAGATLIALPLLALVVSPIQAAAILLPILCIMDLTGLSAFYNKWDRTTMLRLLPGSMLGVGLGWLLAGQVGDREVRIAIGAIAIAFTLNYWFNRRAQEILPQSFVRGTFWGTISGFTSFVAHVGGPPVHVYLLRVGLDKTRFLGTTAVFFTVTNYVKLIPYWLLGQFRPENLGSSLILMPVAVAGVYAGIWLHRRVNDQLYFRIVYALTFATGCKLLWDGLRDISL